MVQRVRKRGVLEIIPMLGLEKDNNKPQSMHVLHSSSAEVQNIYTVLKFGTLAKNIKRNLRNLLSLEQFASKGLSFSP